ncbi:MAG: ABC transporter substrate binding protein [Muribaculaceae bacterium]|nr:ABC transporter substrate binding protein [Muribaculaceae bacterium]
MSFRNKQIIGLLISIIMACLSINANASISDQSSVVKSNNYILIINCHLESIQWNDNFEDAITYYITKQGNYEIYSEHFRSLDVKDQASLDSVNNRIKGKYINAPRAIVMIGPACLAMFGDELNLRWHDVPMIDCVHNRLSASFDEIFKEEFTLDKIKEESESELKKRYNVTGIYTQSKVRETIDLMKRTMPDMDRIVFISDMRFGSYLARQSFVNAMSTYFPHISYELLTSKAYTTSQLLTKIQQYNVNTGIIFHTWSPQGNTAEDYYAWYNLYKIVGTYSKVPVFSQWDMNIKDGYIAGGYMNSLKDLSDASIEILHRILNGEEARKIPFVTVNKARAYLNYTTVEKYGLSKIEYPDDVFYYDRPENIFVKYKYYFLLGAIIIVLFILYLSQRVFFLNRQKKSKQRELEKERTLRNELKLRSMKLSLALEVSTVLPWTWDNDEQIFTFDDSKTYSHPSDGNEAITSIKTFDEVMKSLHPEDRSRIESIFTGMLNGKANYMKEECRVKINEDSEYNWYNIRAIVYEKDSDNNPKIIIGTRTLITEAKELELELRRAKDKAEESSRLKSAFLANISHEIRTPLNAIVGFSGVLADSNSDDEKKELIDIIKQNNQRLLNLINDIIDISKIESDTLEMNYSCFSINDILNKLSKEYSKKVYSGVEINLELPLGDDVMIYDDRTHIKQAIGNIIDNATKFTRRGTITIGYLLPDKEHITFFVKDTGCGIANSDFGNIFERFVKLNSFETGAGLGLTVSKLLIEKLNGRVWLKSEIGVGTQFFIDLPFRATSSPSESDNSAKVKPQVILVAEDILSNFMVLRSMLEPKYNLIHAWNGVDALNLFKKYRPKLVLMDVKMPIMDGYATSAEIKKIAPDTVIIAISSYAFDEDINRMDKYGIDDYEPKPVNIRSLESKIEQLTTKR